MEKKWTTVKELADRLGVSTYKIRQALAEHEVKVFAVGNRWKIDVDDAEKFVEAVIKEGQI